MLWTLDELYYHNNSTQAQRSDGSWGPARPLTGGKRFLTRLRWAWAVFTERADVLVWGPSDLPRV